MSELMAALGSALTEQRWDDYDEIWLDYIEEDRGSIEEFLQAADQALCEGEGARAGLPLSLLVPQADTLDAPKRRRFYETLTCCLPKEREYRNALFDAYQEEYGEIPGFPVYLKAADLKRTNDPKSAIDHFHEMVKYVPGNFVYHRAGWGVGEIQELLVLEGAALIDFQRKTGHRVQVGALPEICTLLAKDHFLVLEWKDPERLRRMGDEQPLELFKRVLATQEKPLPLARIRQLLVGKVIPSPDWSKWWSRQRTALKKDPAIGISGGKTPSYFLLDADESKESELERRLKSQDLRSKLRVLREAVADTKPAEMDLLAPFLDRLAADVVRSPAPPAVRLETVLFLGRHHPHARGLPDLQEMLSEWEHVVDAINSLMRSEDQQEVIDRVRQDAGEGWRELHQELILHADDAPRDYLLSLLQQDGRLDEVREWSREIDRVPRKAPMFFLWVSRLAGRRDYRHIPTLEGARRVDSYLRALALLNDICRRADDENTPRLRLLQKRFRHHLGGRPFTLLDQVTDGASGTECRDIYAQVEASPGFSALQRQALLAFILRKVPDLLAGEVARTVLDDSVVYATDEGILKKRRELESIRNEKLPAIYDAIRDAAALGDLSENAEYTSAIEERENLNRRAVELQAQLDQVQRIDLTDAKTHRVSLGSRVAIRNLRTEEMEEYSILGPWDGDPEHGVVSYLSPLGRALLDRHSGDEVSVTLPKGTARYRVERIGVYGRPDA